MLLFRVYARVWSTPVLAPVGLLGVVCVFSDIRLLFLNVNVESKVGLVGDVVVVSCLDDGSGLLTIIRYNNNLACLSF